MRRLDSTTLACLALCATVLAVAALDFAHTRSRVPELPAANCTTSKSCVTARDLRVEARLRKGVSLEGQFGSRSWIYASAIIAAVVLATALALRRRVRQEWARVFTNLGIAGVWTAIAATVLLLVLDEGPVSLRAAPVYAPPVAMLVLGGLGTVVGWVEHWERDRGLVSDVRGGATAVGKRAIDIGTGGAASRAQYEKLARWLVTATLVLTGLTVALGIAFVVAQPACGADASAADWTDTVGVIATFSALAAIATGIGALLLRRWIPALITLVANPLVGLAMLVSTCALS